MQNLFSGKACNESQPPPFQSSEDDDSNTNNHHARSRNEKPRSQQVLLAKAPANTRNNVKICRTATNDAPASTITSGITASTHRHVSHAAMDAKEYCTVTFNLLEAFKLSAFAYSVLLSAVFPISRFDFVRFCSGVD